MPFDPLKLLLILLNPLTLSLLLCALALLTARPALRLLALASLVVLAGLSLPAVAERLARPLEDRYASQPATDYGRAQAVVLLGGGEAAGEGGAWDLTAQADRMVLAAELWHAQRAPRIIASGGLGRRGDWSEAHAMGYMLRWLGVRREAIEIESRSRNTREHPAYIRPLLDGDAPVLLVTSALHMPRAVARFRAVGIEVIPAPTDRELQRYHDLRDWLPDSRALERSTRVLKERLGLLHARWLP